MLEHKRKLVACTYLTELSCRMYILFDILKNRGIFLEKGTVRPTTATAHRRGWFVRVLGLSLESLHVHMEKFAM